ncbi:cytochrome-b5 reductase [Fusarium denticulatum]|uniref:Cytochrome-b5 reductase n=1 Tax=Fusarium denticulatum TaxID=48507 RepID=A0A8H6CU85_9HYPO|nr:cytochrome-b5 reductase [Fusarium denticulatum]
MAEFTIKQVAEHNSPDDAWLIIHGQVYDVTKYLADHPGGADVLTEAAGTDASEDFDNAGHSEDAFEIMKDCCVGKIQGFEKKKPKLKPLAPVKAVKVQTSGSSSVSTLLNLGFIVCAGAGVYYFGRNQGFTVPNWLLASLGSDSAGSSFIKGIIVGGGSLATANAVAAQRFTSMAMKSKPFTSYPAHMKVPMRAQEDTLLQRGLLDPVTYSPLPLKQRTLIAPNVYRLTFSLPTTSTILGLPIGQHVTIKAGIDGESVARSYTPVSNNSDLGVLELVIKAYPDGKLTSKYLAKLEVGDEVLFRGPKGAMKYQPNLCKKIGMIAGGTGITPMFQVIRAICEHDRDTTEISLIYANRTEQDILLREELDMFARRYPKNFKVYYMLDQPTPNWEFGSGIIILPIGSLVFIVNGFLRATMATQGIFTAKIKHKRAFAPKSRNGCITWVKCDGYAMPKPKAPRRKHRKKIAPSIADDMSLCLTIDDIPSLTTSERMYFQHFLQFTTTQLSLSSGSTNFWLRYALPIGYQFESIRYSMIAVGASHRLFMAKSLGHSDQDGLESFATHQYNKAIATIVPSMTASPDLHVIMICCLLFISFEGLTGRYDELLQHLSAGISLFCSELPSSTDEERTMTTKLAEMFCRLGVESSNFMDGDPSVSGMEKWYRSGKTQDLQSPKPFSNLDEASSALRQLDVLFEEKVWHYEGSDDPNEDILEEATKKLQDALDQWISRLDALYELRKEDIAIEGEQQYHNLRLRQRYWQMTIDLYSSDEANARPETFEPFLAAAKEAAAPFIALKQPTFSLDGDLISGLTFVASTTEDDETKVQVLDLLWRLNRREGLFDSRDIVEMYELTRALETSTEEVEFDDAWKPTAAAGIPTIIEGLRKSLGQLHT